MAKLFDDMLLQGIRSGQMPNRTSTAREWYRNKAKTVKTVSETKLMQESANRMKTQFHVGGMYLFHYDPKHKETLPYYDSLPLIFPIRPLKDGNFLGINLHYLPLPYRAKLMDALYDTVNNKKYDETTKLKLSYNILNGAAKFRFFQPTIKMYLREHVRSKFMYIHPTEWDIAIWLPLERFNKANKRIVWDDSKQKIRGF